MFYIGSGDIIFGGEAVTSYCFNKCICNACEFPQGWTLRFWWNSPPYGSAWSSPTYVLSECLGPYGQDGNVMPLHSSTGCHWCYASSTYTNDWPDTFLEVWMGMESSAHISIYGYITDPNNGTMLIGSVFANGYSFSSNTFTCCDAILYTDGQPAHLSNNDSMFAELVSICPYYNFDGSGWIEFGGHSTRQATYHATTTPAHLSFGGNVWDIVKDTEFWRLYTTSGGLTFDGAATQLFNISRTSSGGVVFDGACTTELAGFNYLYTGSGNLFFDGLAISIVEDAYHYPYTGSGGLTFGGSVNSDNFYPVASGGIVFDGAATTGIGSVSYRYPGSGWLFLYGDSVREATYDPISGLTVFHNGFHYRQSITIPKNSVSEDLFDFPVFVSFDLSGRLTTTHDFDFEDTEHHYLHYDVDSLASGVLAAWVIIPTLKANEDTTFYVYYHKPNQTVSLESNGWDQYLNVYHLNGTYDDAAGTNDGVRHGTIANVAGKFSIAEQFSGNGYIALGQVDSNTPLTVSAWIKTSPYQIEDRIIYSRGNFTLGYDLDGRLFVAAETPSGETRLVSNTTLTAGSWYHVAATYQPQAVGGGNGAMYGRAKYPFKLGFYGNTTSTAGGLSLWINGQSDSATTIENLSSPSLEYIGREGNFLFTGSIDELRIADSVKDPAWIKAEYDGGEANYLLGSEEAAFCLSGSATVETTYATAGSGGIVFNGACQRSVGRCYAGSGGMVFSGAATPKTAYIKRGAGSMAFGGHCARNVAISRVGSGRINTSGLAIAAASAIYTATGSGRIVLGGHGGRNVTFSRTSSGGIVLAGQSTRKATYKRTTIGGFTFGGSATIAHNSTQRVFRYAGSGGLTFDGEATTATWHTSGGLIFGGAASKTSNRLYNGSGRMVWGGDGASLAGYIPVSSGQIRFNGRSHTSPSFSRSGSGGLTLAGRSTRKTTYKARTSGGAVFGGTAIPQAGYRLTGSGRVVISGNAMLSTFYPRTSGTIYFSGEAIEQAAYLYTGSGRILFYSTPIHALLGSIQSYPVLSGKIKSFPVWSGEISTQPALTGRVVCNRNSHALPAPTNPPTTPPIDLPDPDNTFFAVLGEASLPFEYAYAHN